VFPRSTPHSERARSSLPQLRLCLLRYKRGVPFSEEAYSLRVDRRELLGRTGKIALGAGLAIALPEWALGASGPTDKQLRELARALRGSVLTPASPAYVNGRLLYDTRFDGVHPRAIVYCESVSDVQRTVRWARRHGIRIVPRAGGHSFGGYSTTSGVVVDVTRMNQIGSKSPGTAAIGAGALLIDVYAQLATQNVTIPAGSCPSVGVAGLTLGGGASYAGRKLGLTCDSLISAQVVTADGRALSCSQSEHADLLWACRGGGGGNFGIVTSFRFRTHPVGEVAYFGISWPWTDASAVLSAWQEFAPHAPDELYATLYMATSPKGPGKSPAISSGGQFFGTASELQALLAPLVAAGTPKRVTVGQLGYLDAVMRWADCRGTLAECHRADKSTAGKLPRLTFRAKSDYVDQPLSNEAIQTLLGGLEANQADPGLGRAELIFDPYGGAINRVPKAATAFVHRNSLYSIQYVALWARGAAAVPNGRWLRGLYAAMRPFVSGFAYQNYIDPELSDWQQAYYGSNFPRLVAVKRKYDPKRFFRFAQGVPTRP
jgi:hypothetical protein